MVFRLTILMIWRAPPEKKNVYMFSTDNSVDSRLFEGMDEVIVKPIPSKIYEIYKEIKKRSV